MRRIVLVAAALVAVTGGLTAVASTAGAVDDKATCAAVNMAWTDLRNRIEALDGKGSIADLRQIYVDTAGKFDAAAATADQGALKDALNTAAAQLNRLETATNRDDFDGVMRDSAFTAAIDAAGTPCGL
ncbi:hypothetical protein ACIBCN_37235 [Nocardia sp. NPDC051052]|uniref:hypothetical protein n=1 Tax=Nocardia sp. NPDC051052 TaxID=3364322 RepID=UPI00379AD7DA